ncbi:S-layer-like domain-containing protein [Planoprotostelium fungivorum]|uniref:S-layer-like domain-containing protein n=1 Tax=Planoprotostelium fungivorum TaxID=1890364 RepID=A0A2P6N7Z0_9EUKA|nr:S-layer-like domain-containing protein [Planoprotostelium fungivorum]
MHTIPASRREAQKLGYGTFNLKNTVRLRMLYASIPTWCAVPGDVNTDRKRFTPRAGKPCTPTNNNTRTTSNYSTNKMRHAITLLFLALSATAVWADMCQPGYVWCSGVNACYDPSQYSCNADQYHGQYRLCAIGTTSCNDVCIASCAYQCGTDGSYTARTDRSCSSPPSCVTNNMMACGDACYDSSKFCCVSGQPQDISTCPQPTAAVADTTCKSPFGLYNVRSLLGGQLRINAAKSATAAVNFTLSAGSLFDHKGQQCYISTAGQLMYGSAPVTTAANGAVNTVANTANAAVKTIFGISGDYLSHNGSLLWYACSAPNGGSNLYVNKVSGLTCSANYLYATLTGPTVPNVLSNVVNSVLPVTNVVTAVLPVTKVVTSVLPATNVVTNILGGLFPLTNIITSVSPSTPTIPAPTTYIPATSSIPLVTAPCVPGGPSIPVPFCYYSFDNGILNSLLKDDSGNGRIATVLGLPSVILGKTKQALGFDSASGFQGLRLDQTAGLESAFSIATWLKVQASNKVMKIVSAKKGLFSLVSGWELSINPIAKTCTYTSGYSSVSWNINIPTDAWFHLAFTAEKSGKVILYINGVAGAIQNIALSKVTSPLYIAADQSISNFKGALDDFLMFTQSLSAQQILSIISNRCSTSTSAPAMTSQPSTPTDTVTSTPATDAMTYTPTDAATYTPSTDAATTSQSFTPTSSSTVAPSSTTTGGKKCGLPWLYWSFDKIKLGKCTDDSGHGRHGAFSTDISLVVGKLRQALNWKSGNRLYITLPQFDLNKAFTIATWLRLDAIGGKNVIASTKALLSGWELTFDGNAKQITFQPSQGSSVSWDASSLQVGVWAHVAVAVSADRAELYLNGVSCGAKPISALVQSVVGLNVGGKLSADPLRGTLDEFLVFARTLVKEEIIDARDKYLTGAVVPVTNWSQQTTSYDWGTGWELGNILSSVSLNRVQNWWIF